MTKRNPATGRTGAGPDAAAGVDPEPAPDGRSGPAERPAQGEGSAQQSPTVEPSAPDAGGTAAQPQAPPGAEMLGDTGTSIGAETLADADTLARELAEASAEAARQRDAALRALAELENVRRRTERELENARRYGLEPFVKELLPVRDSMELGEAAAGEQGMDVASVREGIALTLRMLASAMEKMGVEEVNPDSQLFDPEYHQAMSVQEAPGVEPGTVINVVQKGYLLNGRLVRPAMVIVAR